MSEALISAAWLATQLDQVNLLDASFALPGSGKNPRAAWATGHIPGAQFFDIEALADPTSSLPHMLPQPQDFAAAMRDLGVQPSRLTVVYDDGGWIGAARAWWMLRVFGQDRVAILDGGLPSWRDAGYALGTQPRPPRRSSFAGGFRPELIWSLAQVQDNMLRGAYIPLDARPAARFTGAAPEPRPNLQRGHIPGAVNIPFTDLIDPITGRLCDRHRLAQRIAASCDPDAPVFATCGSGVSACLLVFVLHLLGRRDVPVYDGSWAEWGACHGLPVALGPGAPLRQSSDEESP